MSDITQTISFIERGDPEAAERLLPLVYDELRRLAGPEAGTGTARTDHTGDGLGP